jgi:shikimate dehydrogenase
MTTFARVAALADNALSDPEGRPFAATLGANPSRGARSPALWNAAFRAHGVDAEMLPIDVPVERLVALLDVLDAIPAFLGGAIAVPHKEAVARWLGDRCSAEAADIGAVNCLYRAASGRLAGTNTDGEGALVSFRSRFGELAGKHVLLIGLGGAGKAVAAFFRRAIEPGGSLTLCSRSDSSRAVAERLSARWIAWADKVSALPETDVLVNCTSIGFGAQVDASPVDATELSRLPASARVFDIVYQPSPTRLLSLASARGLDVLDGTAMNLEQAVLAYGYAAPAPRGAQVTRAAMEEAKKAQG